MFRCRDAFAFERGHIFCRTLNPLGRMPTSWQWPVPQIAITPHGIWTLDTSSHSTYWPSSGERQWFRPRRNRLVREWNLKLEFHFNPMSRNTVKKKGGTKQNPAKNKVPRDSTSSRKVHRPEIPRYMIFVEISATSTEFPWLLPYKQEVPAELLPRQQEFFGEIFTTLA